MNQTVKYEKGEKKLQHKWIIEQFKEIQLYKNETLKSDIFYFKLNPFYGWRISITLNSDGHQIICQLKQLQAEIYSNNILTQQSSATTIENYKFDIVIYAENDLGKHLELYKCHGENGGELNDRLVTGMITFDTLKTYCKNNNSLNIVCDLTKYNLYNDNDNDNNNYISDLFENFWLSSDCADFIFKCTTADAASTAGDNQQYKTVFAHKFILITASPLLAKIIEQQTSTNSVSTTTSTTTTIKNNKTITDLDENDFGQFNFDDANDTNNTTNNIDDNDLFGMKSDKFEIIRFENMLGIRTGFNVGHIAMMLSFIYTGCIYYLESTHWQMLRIAETFQLEELSTVCVQSIRKSIQLENAINIYLQSDTYQNVELRNYLIDYIFEHANVLRKTIEWQNLLQLKPKLLANLWCKRFS